MERLPLGKISLITTNPNKAKEIVNILEEYSIGVEWIKMELIEIQSNDLVEIVKNSAYDALSKIDKPFLIEDAGLFIDALNGFPGPYSAYAFKTIGNDGILRLMEKVSDRSSVFKSAIAYRDSKKGVNVFVGETYGTIAFEKRGIGWGFDPIFIPDEFPTHTYAELGDLKNRVSHRKKALEKLASWLKSSDF
ncbi:MAG: RdgB/HAM1 family non-canonical purine NTP pyrophosphatase [Candidatus Bathyarchaeia archaeon]